MTMHILKPITVLIVAATLLAAPSLASAQNSSAGGSSAISQQTLSELKTVIKEYRDAARKLLRIGQKTLDENPHLKDLRQSFRQKVKAAMAKKGYDVKKIRNQLRDLVKKLKAGNLSKSQRQELARKLRDVLKKLREAKRAALQDPAVRAARHKLLRQTLQAMRKQSSDTDKLIARMKDLKRKLRSIRQEIRANASGSGNQGG